jgi:DNA invertase Pin-like site-specific DNA recombinase
MAIRHRTTSDTSVQVPDAAVVIPAVGYLRCSDDSQIAASIPAQKSEVEKYATAHGYNVLRWYIDGGISGWKEDREQFQRLIADVEQRRDFRAVVCWHSNRFSRFPVLEANHYWYLLERAGVSLVTVAQGKLDFGDIGSWLKASIEQHGDAQHRFKLSADVRRGQRRIAEQGIWGCVVPTGYRLGADRRLTPDPVGAALVRRIFEQYIRLGSLRALAHWLNNEGIPAARGGGWTPTSARGLLSNVAYVGIYRRHGVEIRDAHPAVIDRELFDRVQGLLAQRKRQTTPHEGGGDFLLTGLIRCGLCETTMRGDRGNYVCRTMRDKGTAFCRGQSVPQSDVIGAMTAAIAEWASDPAVTVAFRDEVLRAIREESITGDDPHVLEGQLATVVQRLAKAKRRLVEVDTDLLPVVQEQLRGLLTERDRLQAALQAAQTPLDAVLVEVDAQLAESFRAFQELPQTVTEADPVMVRDTLHSLVHRVDVWGARNGKGWHLDHGEATLTGLETCTESQPSSK